LRVRAAVGRSVGCVLRWIGCWCRGGRRMAKQRHELFVFVREPAALPDNKRGGTGAAADRDAPEDQRGDALDGGERDEDDAGLTLRDVATTRHQSLHRLPRPPPFP